MQLQEEEQDAAAREREVRQEVTRRIKQLGQQRKFKEAVQQLASLADLGIQPDTQAATALLAACTRSRDMKMAQSIFEQLFGEGPGLLWAAAAWHSLTSWYSAQASVEVKAPKSTQVNFPALSFLTARVSGTGGYSRTRAT